MPKKLTTYFFSTKNPYLADYTRQHAFYNCQSCNSFGTILFIHSIYFLDGLDIDKQKFTGRIATSKNVISSQGALNYEGIITKENPNKTAPGERK